MRVAIIGPSRCGKDEVSEMLRRHGLRYDGSVSWHCKSHMSKMLNCSEQFAWEHRHTHKEIWRYEIDRLRAADPACIVDRILKTSDIVTGIRPRAEMDASRYMFDLVVWVERNVPHDPTLELTPDDADVILLNNKSLAGLYLAVKDLWQTSLRKGHDTCGLDAPMERTSTQLQPML